ncbi:MFS transporter [Alsobacter sp. R-9]
MATAVTRATAVLAVTQVTGWGTTFYLPAIIGRAMARDLGLTTEFVFFGVTLMVIVMAVVSPWLGKRLDRVGAAGSLVAGSCVFALALATLGMARGPTSYAAGWLLIGLGGSLALSLPAFTALAQVAGQAARGSMSTLMLFTGIASSISWPVTGWLDAHVGWRGVCFTFAVVHVLLCLPLHAFVLPRRSAVAGGAGPTPAPSAVTPEGRRLAVLVMAPCFALSGFVSWGLSLHVLELLEQSGLSEAVALTVASSMGLVSTGARVADFALGRRFSPMKTALGACGLIVISFAVFAVFIGSPTAAIGFIGLYAFGTGLFAVSRATLPLWVFGSASYGTFAGRLAFGQNVANAVAPVVLAFVIDRQGIGPAIGLLGIASAGAFLLLAGLTLVVRRHEVPVPAEAVAAPETRA